MPKVIHDNSFELVSLPLGEVERVYYSKVVDDNGNSIFTERRRVNIQEDIQSYKDGCMISTLLSRLSRCSADQIVSACSQVDTVSADLVGMPKDLTEAFMSYNSLEKRYPGVMKKIASGASLDDLKNMFVSTEEKPSVEESEVSDNGSI